MKKQLSARFSGGPGDGLKKTLFFVFKWMFWLLLAFIEAFDDNGESAASMYSGLVALGSACLLTTGVFFLRSFFDNFSPLYSLAGVFVYLLVGLLGHLWFKNVWGDSFM